MDKQQTGIIVPFPKQDRIDVSAIKRNPTKLDAGMIRPAQEEVTNFLADDHTAEPIKSMDDILRISEYLIEQERYRDNMLFIVGINFGLRVSDLRMLRFCDLIDSDFTFKESFPVFEIKTRNTRKKKKNRYITINQAVIDAVSLYLTHTEDVCLSDYMFRSASNNGKDKNLPIHRNMVDRILKGIAKDLCLDMKMSTHTLRKTWAYHQMMMSGNDPRKLLLLQKMMGHSSVMQTLEYIGLTQEEMRDAYLGLNLGSKTQNYLIDSQVIDISEAVG